MVGVVHARGHGGVNDLPVHTTELVAVAGGPTREVRQLVKEHGDRGRASGLGAGAHGNAHGDRSLTDRVPQRRPRVRHRREASEHRAVQTATQANGVAVLWGTWWAESSQEFFGHASRHAPQLHETLEVVGALPVRRTPRGVPKPVASARQGDPTAAVGSFHQQ